MTSPAVVVAILAANAAAAEQRLLDVMRLADATASTRAQTPEALGVARDDLLARLAARGLLRDAGDGRIYLDEAALIRGRTPPMSARTTRIILLVMVALTAVTIGVTLAMFGGTTGRGTP